MKKQLIQNMIELAKEEYDQLTDYSQTLHRVIDVLQNSSPQEWVAIGETIMNEGAYQMIARAEGREILYDVNADGRINDKLLPPKNLTSVP